MGKIKKITLILIAIVVIPIGIYTISPYFTNTTIDEAFPLSSNGNVLADDIPEAILLGRFVGVDDGIHDATGDAKILKLDNVNYLRFENFEATNGPDLHVYLAIDDKATEFVDLGLLKANIGNQNYEIPKGTDLSKYDKVLVWCQMFSVLFGSAELQ